MNSYKSVTISFKFVIGVLLVVYPNPLMQGAMHLKFKSESLDINYSIDDEQEKLPCSKITLKIPLPTSLYPTHSPLDKSSK